MHQLHSPDLAYRQAGCSEKPCAAKADFFLADSKRPEEALGAA